MPEMRINSDGRRRGTRRHTFKANGQVNGQIHGTGFVNGPVVPSNGPAAASSTSESNPAVTLHGTQTQGMVNGYINYRYKGKSTNLAQLQSSRISAVTDASAAGRASCGGVPRSILVSGTTSPPAFAHNSEQMTPECSLSAAVKNKRRWKKSRHKKRDTEVDCLENCKALLMPPQEEEDWENEIALSDWENGSFGIRPYGPEDVLHFALQDMTLQQKATADLPWKASYNPATHHAHPVQWTCQKVFTHPGQFADAED